MNKNLIGLNITYRYYKGKTQVVTLLLHGWGGNLNSFRFLESHLKQKKLSVLTLDFPGFGGSDAPREDFELDDYYKIVEQLLIELNISKINIVAHSFGGRIALLVAARKPEIVNKLVLVDSAGIKPRFSIKKSIKVWHYKFLKKLKKAGIIKKDLSNFGSSDYRAMPNSLKPVFNRIVNNNITTNELKSIQSPALIVWGKDDDSTPFYMAKKLNKHIKDSAIVALDGGHFAYLQNAEKFLIILNSFIGDNDESI